MEADAFYEDDEPIEKIKAIFDALPKVLTARPVTAGGDPATNRYLRID